MKDNKIEKLIRDKCWYVIGIAKDLKEKDVEVYANKFADDLIDLISKDCISKSEVEILRQLIAETDITKEQIYERLLKIAPLPKLT